MARQRDWKKFITNKVRSWERSEPRSEPFVGQARFSERLRCYANSFLSARVFLVKPDRLMTVLVCSIQFMAVVILFWVANTIFSPEFRASKSLQRFWLSSTRVFICAHMIRCPLAFQPGARTCWVNRSIRVFTICIGWPQQAQSNCERGLCFFRNRAGSKWKTSVNNRIKVLLLGCKKP